MTTSYEKALKQVRCPVTPLAATTAKFAFVPAVGAKSVVVVVGGHGHVIGLSGAFAPNRVSHV